MKKIFLVSFILLLVVAMNSWANSDEPTEKGVIQKDIVKTNRLDDYQTASFHKLERGTINTLAFWSDLPDEIGSVSKKEGALKGATFGVVQGLLKSTGRLILGVADVLTFPVAPQRKPSMEPEYADGSLDAKVREFLW